MERRLDVAVCGAGIAGLAVAVLLHQAGHRVRVYERDAHAATRDQGGSIGIDGAIGRRVIERMGLDDAFAAISHPEEAVSRLVDASGTVVRPPRDDPGSRDAEAERPELRRMLLEHLPADTVRWGHRLRTLDERDGRPYLTFTDGSDAVADLVVGGDGAWSRVRAAVGGTEPTYSGITFLDRRFPDVDRDFPSIAHTIQRGTLFAHTAGLGLIAQRTGRNARVYVAFRAELDHVGSTPAAELRADLERTFTEAGWDASLVEFTTAGEEPGSVRPVFEHPVGHRWERRVPATLVGDAAHLQSPFCALGTNNALLDAADLVDALHDSTTVADALAAYESRMWRRAAASAEAAHASIRAFMHDEAPEEYLRLRRTSSCRPEPSAELAVPRSPEYVEARFVPNAVSVSLVASPLDRAERATY